MLVNFFNWEFNFNVWEWNLVITNIPFFFAGYLY